MNLTYRKLQPSESVMYRNIRLESLRNFPDSFCSDYAAQEAKPKLGFQEYIEQENNTRFIIGVFDQDQLIGICGFYQHPDCNMQHRGEIIQMYVKPGHQGKSIGKHLIEKTLEEAFSLSAVEQVELGVLSTAPAASRLYDRVGFKEYGFQHNCFKTNGEYIHQRMMVMHRRDHEKK